MYDEELFEDGQLDEASTQDKKKKKRRKNKKKKKKKGADEVGSDAEGLAIIAEPSCDASSRD